MVKYTIPVIASDGDVITHGRARVSPPTAQPQRVDFTAHTNANAGETGRISSAKRDLFQRTREFQRVEAWPVLGAASASKHAHVPTVTACDSCAVG